MFKVACIMQGDAGDFVTRFEFKSLVNAWFAFKQWRYACETRAYQFDLNATPRCVFLVRDSSVMTAYPVAPRRI